MTLVYQRRRHRLIREKRDETVLGQERQRNSESCYNHQ